MWKTDIRLRRCHVLLVLLLAGISVPAALVAQAPAPPAETAKDPFGRDTPRGTVYGFMRAASDPNNEAALAYLNTNLKGATALELAHQLHVVLDSKLPARLNEVSDRPEGARTNPLKPDQDVVGTITTADGPLDIVVERVRVGNEEPLWLFAPASLRAIPDVYHTIDRVSVDHYLPDLLVKPRFLGIRVGTWVVLLLVIPGLYRLLGSSSALAVKAWRRKRPKDHVVYDRLPGSIRVLLIAIAVRILIRTIDLPLFERQFWNVLTAMLTILGMVWLVLAIINFGQRKIERRFQAAGMGDKTALLRLGGRAVDVLVVAAGALIVLNVFGIDPTAALAGLGIGGIAVALAAQKTLENVIGGLSLVFDEAVRVGDTIKLGETVGTVDQIGLRSTRIRTMDRTMVAVPNGLISTASVETLSVRDKFLFRHVVGLRYETTSAQLRALVDSLRDLLAAKTGVELESVRVRFIRIAASSLELELFAYIYAVDWPRFLEIQQELLLSVMELVEASGSGIAFPSQTLYVNERRPAGLLSGEPPIRSTPRDVEAQKV